MLFCPFVDHLVGTYSQWARNPRRLANPSRFRPRRVRVFQPSRLVLDRMKPPARILGGNRQVLRRLRIVSGSTHGSRSGARRRPSRVAVGIPSHVTAASTAISSTS